MLLSIGREAVLKTDQIAEETPQDDTAEIQDDEIDDDVQFIEENVNTGENQLTDNDDEVENQMIDEESDENFLLYAPKNSRCKKREVSKENDIKTLKYPQKGEGLTQIAGNPHFYIRSDKLKMAEKNCNNVRDFARRLFKEVFTEQALQTCSMTGFKKPPLHYEARTTLKNYALAYGKRVRWPRVEPEELDKTLQRFLHNCSRKLGTRVDKPKRKYFKGSHYF